MTNYPPGKVPGPFVDKLKPNACMTKSQDGTSFAATTTYVNKTEHPLKPDSNQGSVSNTALSAKNNVCKTKQKIASIKSLNYLKSNSLPSKTKFFKQIYENKFWDPLPAS
jgi:hypothetical protein